MSASFLPANQWTGRSDNEDGERARRLHQLVVDKANQALIGFACDAGVSRNQGRPGAALAPNSIRHAMANMAATSAMEPFVDLGDISVKEDALESGQQLLGDHIGRALANGMERIVVLGGGHETAYGSYLGLRTVYPDHCIGIINLDAHFDLRAPGERGPSSGTPFHQIRQHKPTLFDYLCLGVAEEANTVALFERAARWQTGTVSDHALIADPHIADGLIDRLASRCDIVYLTIDMDVLPHYQAPGVSAPAPRGVPLTIIEHLVNQTLVACRRHGTPMPVADIVEVSPPLDQDDVTAKTAALLCRRLLMPAF
ncbi:MAG: formimidoylglutamase [Pseudomonadota bacterium]